MNENGRERERDATLSLRGALFCSSVFSCHSRGIDDMFVDVTEDSILIDDEADEEEIDRLKKEKWAELRDRDVTKSVMGLKRQLHAEDFEKIFERRNPRIGER